MPDQTAEADDDTVQFNVRLTRARVKTVRRLAEAEGMTLSEFMDQLILERQVKSGETLRRHHEERVRELEAERAEMDREMEAALRLLQRGGVPGRA